MPNRGHSLTIDHGWQEVAQTARSTSSRREPSIMAASHGVCEAAEEGVNVLAEMLGLR
jgi:hypothetical protein